MAQNVERVVDTTVARAEGVKVQTADALEEAARKLRETNVAARGDEVKAILNDLETRTAELRSEVEKKVEPVETFITEHPFASVMIAVGVGFMIGTLLRRD